MNSIETDVHIRGSTEDGQETKQQFAKNLKRYMKLYGYSQHSLAKELGLSTSSVSQWCRAQFFPRAGMIEKLAELFHCYKSDLLEDKSSIVDLSIPIYDSVSCGQGAFIDENITDSLSLPSNWIKTGVDYFANEAEGDSMEPLIEHGDLLVFEKTEDVPVGRIGAFSLNGQYYCKRLKKYKDGTVVLSSDNDDYSPISVRPEDDFRCLGFFRFKVSKVQ